MTYGKWPHPSWRTPSPITILVEPSMVIITVNILVVCIDLSLEVKKILKFILWLIWPRPSTTNNTFPRVMKFTTLVDTSLAILTKYILSSSDLCSIVVFFTPKLCPFWKGERRGSWNLQCQVSFPCRCSIPNLVKFLDDGQCTTDTNP